MKRLANILSVNIHTDVRHAAGQILVSMAGLAQYTVAILTLGFVLPYWSYNVCMWVMHNPLFNKGNK